MLGKELVRFARRPGWGIRRCAASSFRAPAPDLVVHERPAVARHASGLTQGETNAQLDLTLARDRLRTRAATQSRGSRGVWMSVALSAGALILVTGTVWYLNRPPTIAPVLSSDPCTAMEKRLDDLHEQKHDQTRKLSALLGDGGFQVEGSDTVEDLFHTTYATFGAQTEACRLLHIGIQCADKRRPNGALALKLAEAIPAICAPAASSPLPTTPAPDAQSSIVSPRDVQRRRDPPRTPLDASTVETCATQLVRRGTHVFPACTCDGKTTVSPYGTEVLGDSPPPMTAFNFPSNWPCTH